MELKPDRDQRAALYDAIERGELGFPEALKQLRRSVGKTQAEYAELVGLSVRVLKQIEQGRGNPTLKSIRKALRPFNLELTIRTRGPGSS